MIQKLSKQTGGKSTAHSTLSSAGVSPGLCSTQWGGRHPQHDSPANCVSCPSNTVHLRPHVRQCDSPLVKPRIYGFISKLALGIHDQKPCCRHSLNQQRRLGIQLNKLIIFKVQQRISLAGRRPRPGSFHQLAPRPWAIGKHRGSREHCLKQLRQIDSEHCLKHHTHTHTHTHKTHTHTLDRSFWMKFQLLMKR